MRLQALALLAIYVVCANFDLGKRRRLTKRLQPTKMYEYPMFSNATLGRVHDELLCSLTKHRSRVCNHAPKVLNLTPRSVEHL